jgi:IclR family transcriptional regulator, acetate operon repressor
MSSPDTTQMPDLDKETGGAQAVTRALAVLACFRDGSPDLGVSDIARALELKPSTAHRLVRTLLRAGFLEQNTDTSRYRLGNALAE